MSDETQEKASSGDTYNLPGDFRDSTINIKSPITNIIPRQRTCPTPPPAPDHFGGRDVPLADLKQRLKDGKFTAITAVHGLGGIGKTTLAKKLANDLFYDEQTFRAVLWADLTRNPDPLSLLISWANYADPAFVPGDKPLHQVALQVKSLLESVIGEQCQTCPSHRVLVVLDDVWESGKEAVRLLRSACPNGSTLLLTTRNEGLGYDLGANMTSLDRLTKAEGIELLQEYLPDAEPELLGKLSEVLGGHPLALTLAARRVQKKKVNRARALAEQLAEYERKLPALTNFNSLQLDQGQSREDNLSLVLSYSYAELEEAEQARFRALGVLVYDQPFDLGLLGAIWNLSSEDEEGENRALIEGYCEGLCLRGLLEVYEGVSSEDGNSWYRQHPLLQAYARALLLQDAAEHGTVLVRYQEQVIEIANQFQKLQPEDWGQLTPYLPHIHAIGDGLVEQTATLETLEDEALIRRAQSFAYKVLNYLEKRREVKHPDWIEMGLKVSQRLKDSGKEGSFLGYLGSFYDARGEKNVALDYYQQALQLRREAGDQKGEATYLHNMGGVYSAIGEKVKALEFYEMALPLMRAVGDRGGEATTLNNMGAVYDAIGEKVKAL
ncbi:MAG: tetratricopeptide repeat protein, partial [Chloroflexi bacterium]|nr:tetratricopeptide repeat protein [Chloroflexota bacterium]